MQLLSLKRENPFLRFNFVNSFELWNMNTLSLYLLSEVLRTKNSSRELKVFPQMPLNPKISFDNHEFQGASFYSLM